MEARADVAGALACSAGAPRPSRCRSPWHVEACVLAACESGAPHASLYTSGPRARPPPSAGRQKLPVECRPVMLVECRVDLAFGCEGRDRASHLAVVDVPLPAQVRENSVDVRAERERPLRRSRRLRRGPAAEQQRRASRCRWRREAAQKRDLRRATGRRRGRRGRRERQ